MQTAQVYMFYFSEREKQLEKIQTKEREQIQKFTVQVRIF